MMMVVAGRRNVMGDEVTETVVQCGVDGCWWGGRGGVSDLGL